jgi:hypothetical protein
MGGERGEGDMWVRVHGQPVLLNAFQSYYWSATTLLEALFLHEDANCPFGSSPKNALRLAEMNTHFHGSRMYSLRSLI